MDRRQLENIVRKLPKLQCELERIKNILDNIPTGNNSIISLDSISSDINGKLSITFTDSIGQHTIETNSLQKFIIKYNVQNYNELLTAVPNLYEYAYIREEQGIKWLPGSLGGTYYPAGLYMWDGVKWVKDDMTLINEINNIINTMDTWEQTQW